MPRRRTAIDPAAELDGLLLRLLEVEAVVRFRRLRDGVYLIEIEFNGREFRRELDRSLRGMSLLRELAGMIRLATDHLRPPEFPLPYGPANPGSSG